ncbi:trypsin-like [Neodiprion fabricii]|uniref:trypsin-like n=1 Tax=Neodiprion fabricii TaxID=2872261 RepID=UPI001ED8FB8F|nr:trypsin-like [Neodiprion fabricii]
MVQIHATYSELVSLYRGKASSETITRSRFINVEKLRGNKTCGTRLDVNLYLQAPGLRDHPAAGCTENKEFQLLIVLQFASTGFGSSRIAAGESTTLGEFSFILSLGLTSWANVYHLHYCAGFVVTESWVITAAHCVEDAVQDVGRYYWLAGTNNLRQGGTQYFIGQIVIHPDYAPDDSLIHDVALVKVRNPFEFSNTIQPIGLARSSAESTSGTRGVVVGWGEVSQTVIQPDVLRSAEVTIIDGDLCREIYAPWHLTIHEEYQFCALSTNDEAKTEARTDSQMKLDRRACRGDEGGPFFYRDLQPSFAVDTAMGFVSWTYGCTPSGYPAVYVKISPYLEWIREITASWI